MLAQILHQMWQASLCLVQVHLCGMDALDTTDCDARSHVHTAVGRTKLAAHIDTVQLTPSSVWGVVRFTAERVYSRMVYCQM